MTKIEHIPPNPFRSVDAQGRPVTRRFSDARSMREIYKTLQEADAQGEAPRRAKIRRMYDFFRPYDMKKLEAAGIKDMANINLGGLHGQVAARSGAISALAADTTDLVELRALPAEMAGPDAEAIGTVVAEEFSTVLREGPGFISAVAMSVREADLYGIGPISWRDPYDFQPIALERGQVKFPSNASAISGDNELIFVETAIPVGYFVSLFDYPKESEAVGWDLAIVRKYLIAVFSAKQDTTSQARDTAGTSVEESLLSEWRQNRMYETQQFEVVRVISAYVKECSGAQKIAHYMIPAMDSGLTPDGFLFLKEDAYETMNSAILWLPFDPSENYARSQRGLASKILPFEDLRNRTLCKVVDAAMREASIKLEATSAGEATRNTIVEQGPYTFFTGGVTPVTGKTAPDFTGLAAVYELLGRVSTNNVTGAQGAGAAPERVYAGADRKTKVQVQAEAEAGAKSEQTLFTMRALFFDTLFRECFRRFMKIVLDQAERAKYPGVTSFVDRCERRGVTMAILKKVPANFALYTCRDLVNGGAEAKVGGITNLLTSFGGNLDEKGRINGTRDLIRASMGRAAADRYRPDVGRDTMPGDAASHAVMENNDLMEGAAVLVGTDQLHWSHIPVHSQLLDQIAKAVEAGRVEDPAAMLKTLQATSQHVERHAQIGGAQLGKAADAKAVIQALRSLRPVGQSLTMMAQTQEHEREAEAKRQQQAQEELQKRADGQDAQAAMHDSDNKAAVKMYEVDKMAEVRMADASNKAQTDAFKARSKASIDRISARYRMMTQNSAMTGAQTPGVGAMAGEGDEEGLAGSGLF